MGSSAYIPNQDYHIYNAGNHDPVTEITPESTFSGTATALAKGVGGGIAAMGHTAWDFLKTQAAYNAAYGASPYAESGATADNPNEVFAQTKATLNAATAPATEWFKRAQEWSKADPRTTGSFAQLSGSVSRGLTILGVGSVVGGPWTGAAALGLTEGHADYVETEGKADEGTRFLRAGIIGTTAFAGAALPQGVSTGAAKYIFSAAIRAEAAGNTALANVLVRSAELAAKAAGSVTTKYGTAVASNVGFGMGQRYLLSEVLEARGYKDMAAQFQVFDKEALFADAILGAAFGAFSHLTALKKTKLELAEARKLATDIETLRKAPAVSAVAEAFALEPVVRNLDPVAKADTRVYGEGANAGRAARFEFSGEVSHPLGWDAIEGRIPEMLRERFREDRAASDRNVNAALEKLRGLDESAQKFLTRGRQKIHDKLGYRGTDAEVAKLLREDPAAMAQAKTLAEEHARLERALQRAESFRDTTLEKWGQLDEVKSLRATERPDTALVDTALDMKRQEMQARGAVGIPKDFWFSNLDTELQDRATADLLRGEPVKLSPQEAQAAIDRAMPDPEKLQLHDDFMEAGKRVLGSFADGAEPKRLKVKEPEFKPLAPEPPRPKAEGAAKPVLEVDPVQREEIRALAERYPDMEIETPDGKVLKASEADAFFKELGDAAEFEAKVIDATIACVMESLR